MFTFNFLDLDKSEQILNQSQHDDICWLESQEIKAEVPISTLKDNNSEFNVFKYGEDSTIKCICINNVVDVLKKNCCESSVIHADRNHSDLVAGVYEGGLKIWECTHDLANYICDAKLQLRNKTVLDLGCGAGIVGILSLSKGASTDFQDYNYEVIKYITIPNVVLNGDEYLSSCKFYSGDWMSFVDKLIRGNHKRKYDFIFTSETIYNRDNYGKLFAVFKNLLGENGSIYVAAKTYYFGVGGGLRNFEDAVSDENLFDVATCWTSSEGVQREILSLKFKNSVY